MSRTKESSWDFVREAELLADISDILTQFDMHRALGRVVRLVTNAVGAVRAHLALAPHYELDWRLIFQTNTISTDAVYTVGVGWEAGSLAGAVAEARKVQVIADSRQEPRFTGEIGAERCALAVPLICGSDLMAVLTLLHGTPDYFQKEHLRLVRTAMNQAAVAIHNARLEGHVRSGAHQFAAVLHAVNNPMLVLDRAGRVMMMNAAASRYLGTPVVEMAPERPLAELAHDDSAFDAILDIIANPPPQPQHWLFKSRSEQKGRDFEVLMSVWENPLQGQSGYVVMMHDITTLVELDRFKNDMLRMASHDLRTPLALITGYCDVLELDLPSIPVRPELVRYLNAIRKTTARMDALLTDILEVERVQSSPLELHRDIAVDALLEEVVDHVQASITQKQHKLFTVFESLPSTVVGDPLMLREAMENLITNAIKYTPDGGRIQVHAFGQDNALHFVVQDNGIGIPQAAQAKLFTSFYRVKQAGTEHISGTGMGLSLVKNIIERHQGQVWFKSEPGVGSEFGFHIPLAVQEEEP